MADSKKICFEIDPKRVDDLTDREKWECTARWLNYLYNGYYWMMTGRLAPEEFLDGIPNPCTKECPCYEKCPSVAKDPYRPFRPIYTNFQVMSQFIPGSTVVSLSFPQEGTPHEDSAALPGESRNSSQHNHK